MYGVPKLYTSSPSNRIMRKTSFDLNLQFYLQNRVNIFLILSKLKNQSKLKQHLQQQQTFRFVLLIYCTLKKIEISFVNEFKSILVRFSINFLQIKRYFVSEIFMLMPYKAKYWCQNSEHWKVYENAKQAFLLVFCYFFLANCKKVLRLNLNINNNKFNRTTSASWWLKKTNFKQRQLIRYNNKIKFHKLI